MVLTQHATSHNSKAFCVKWVKKMYFFLCKVLRHCHDYHLASLPTVAVFNGLQGFLCSYFMSDLVI